MQSIHDGFFLECQSNAQTEFEPTESQTLRKPRHTYSFWSLIKK